MENLLFSLPILQKCYFLFNTLTPYFLFFPLESFKSTPETMEGEKLFVGFWKMSAISLFYDGRREAGARDHENESLICVAV